MITVWGRRSSSNVQAVLWCLAEVDEPFERIDAGFTYGVVNTPEYLSMNPNATVPTLKDGESPVIWESGAIIRYLAKRYGDVNFWPVELVDQTRVDQWAEWSKINLALKFTAPIFWKVVRTAPSKQDQTAIAEGIRVFTEKLRIAEQQLQKTPFLTGEHLTFADIQMGHVLYRYFDIEIARPELPAVRAYYEKLTARPQYRDAVMVSYDELRVLDV